MGVGASTSAAPPPPSQQPQDESLAALTTPLPILRAAFSSLASLPALRQSLSLPAVSFSSGHPKFVAVAASLGSAIASLFPAPSADSSSSNGEGDSKQLGWHDFLKGYNSCTARAPVSRSLSSLLRVFASACSEVGLETGLSFEPPVDADVDDDQEARKAGGSLSGEELLVFFHLCWVMEIVTVMGGDVGEGLVLPDLSHLVKSVLVSGGAAPDDGSIWELDVSNGNAISVPVQKFQAWMLTAAVGLGKTLSQYVQARIQASAASRDIAGTSISDNGTSMLSDNTGLLMPGVAWSLSLTAGDNLSKHLLKSSFPGRNQLDPLYRSSIHGKGLNRFWSCVEGYNGPAIILLSSYSTAGSESDSVRRRWVIGMLTEQGFENKDTYYGTSGSLYAIHPFFRVLASTGKERNLIYCHTRPAVRAYEAKPKPVCLAFGGALGNERIVLDEDFASITIRHHAVDKTYQPGSLIPNQGFLPVEAPVVDIEAWGLGGTAAKERQDAFKNREKLFSDQRRKVDLKTFGSWEDSPEKMMMDMVSDPNKVRREDR